MSDQHFTKEHFYHELVNRFFHENSYFLHCLNHELEGVLAEIQDSDNQKYLLLGSLIDKFVALDDVTPELERLGQIEGFDEFIDKLEQGVAHLHEAELDTERMKIEIEGLAHSLFNSALLAFQNPETLEKIESLFDLKFDKENSKEIEELSSYEPGNAVIDFSLQDEQHLLSQEEIKEQDVLFEAQEDMDVSSKGGLDSENSIEDSSSSLKKPNRNGKENSLNEEPASFIPAFEKAIKEQINNLDLELVKNTLNHKAITNILNAIITTSVIYGFEAFEQIALKTKKHLENVNKNLEKYVLDEFKEVLLSFFEENPENISLEYVKDMTARILSSEKTDSSEDNEFELTNGDQKKSTDLDAEPELDRTTQAPNNTNTIIKFKLPGEDDEEILNLIAEISGENDIQYKSVENVAASPYDIDVSGHIVRAVEDDALSIYKQQAELYFGVIDEALNTLEKQKRNRTALEDLELASNALYSLSLKLNLDPASEFPELILRMTKNVLATDYSFSEKEHGLLKDSFFYFKNFNTLKPEERNNFSDLIADIKGLNEKVKVYAVDQGEVINLPSPDRLSLA